LTSIYDEPYSDSSAIPTLLVSKMAKQHVTVTLSGDGGDELFHGYGAYQWAKRLNNPLFKSLKTPISTILKNGNQRMQHASWMFNFDKNENLNAHIFSQEQYLFGNKEIKKLFNNKYNNNNLNINYKNFNNRKLTPSEKQAIFDLKYYLPDDLLVKVDRASMHHSLETRVPLLDYRIVEFALNLSPELKYRQSQTKYLLKQVLYKYIPKQYFDRPKWGFSIPLSKWMRSQLKDYIYDNLASSRLKETLYCDIDNIYAVKQWKNGNDLYYNRIWQLVVLSRFLEN